MLARPLPTMSTVLRWRGCSRRRMGASSAGSRCRIGALSGMSAPRGACVVLDGKKPVFADLFCTNMFQATAIREIRFDNSELTASRRRTRT